MIKYREYENITTFLQELKYHHFSSKQLTKICHILLSTNSFEDQENLLNVYEPLINSTFLKLLPKTETNKTLLLKLIIVISYISSKKDVEERNRLAMHIKMICQHGNNLFNYKFLSKEVKSLILKVYISTQNPHFYKECFALLSDNDCLNKSRFVAFMSSLKKLKGVPGEEEIKSIVHYLLENTFSEFIKQNPSVDLLKKLHINFADLIKDKEIKFVDIGHLKVANAIIEACLEAHSMIDLSKEKPFCPKRMMSLFGLAHGHLIHKFATPDRAVLLDHIVCIHLSNHASEISTKMNEFFEMHHKQLEKITIEENEEKIFFAKLKYFLPLFEKYSLSYGRKYINAMVEKFANMKRPSTKFTKTMNAIIDDAMKLGFYDSQKAESVEERTQIQHDKRFLNLGLLNYYFAQDQCLPTVKNSAFSKINMLIFENILKELDLNDVAAQATLSNLLFIYNMVLIHDLHDASLERHELFLKSIENVFLKAENNITSKKALDYFYCTMHVLLQKILFRTYHLQHRYIVLNTHKFGDKNCSTAELQDIANQFDNNKNQLMNYHMYYNSKEVNLRTKLTDFLLFIEDSDYVFTKALEMVKAKTRFELESIREHIMNWVIDFLKKSAKRSHPNESLFAKMLCSTMTLPFPESPTPKIQENFNDYAAGLQALLKQFAPKFKSTLYEIKPLPKEGSPFHDHIKKVQSMSNE